MPCQVSYGSYDYGELRKVMQQVTAKKFAEMCNCSDANIRSLCGRGITLEGIKDENDEWIIDIDVPKNREYLNKRTRSSQPVPQEFTEEITELNNQTFERITQRIEELSIKAGRLQQIESNLIERQNDVEYWKNLYLELNQSYTALREKYATIETENKFLKEKLNSGLFGWFKKRK